MVPLVMIETKIPLAIKLLTKRGKFLRLFPKNEGNSFDCDYNSVVAVQPKAVFQRDFELWTIDKTAVRC